MCRLRYPFIFVLVVFSSNLQIECSSGLSSTLLGTSEQNVSLTADGSTDFRKLAFTKLGVAIAMFISVLIVCGLPIVIMSCLKKRTISSSLSHIPSSSQEGFSSFSQTSAENHADQTLVLLNGFSASEEGSNHEHEDTLNFGQSAPINDNIYDRNNYSTSVEPQFTKQLSTSSTRPLIRNDSPDCTSRRRRHQLRKKTMQVWVSRVTCFAAGIFLSTGFMDLFPDVEEAISAALSRLEIHTDYPCAALSTLIGFFIVFFIEQSVLVLHHKNRSRYLRQPMSQPNNPINDDDQKETTSDSFGSHGHSHIHPTESDDLDSTMRVMLLLIALSVHSVFEGLAVGLQKTIHEVVSLFSALMLHKLIMAASIGVSLATAHEQASTDKNASNKKSFRAQVICCLVFALASPIGVLIGSSLVSQSSSGALLLTVAILQGLACGTFFFVVFLEMLPHEFKEGSTDRIGKLISLFTGFAVVAIYILFEPK